MPIVIGLIAGLLWAVFAALKANDFGLMAGTRWSREASVLLNPNTYAISLLIGSMLAWYLFQNTNKILVKGVAVGMAVLFLHQIMFYSGSRKGILAVFLIYPSFLLLRQALQPRRSMRKLLLTASLVIVLCILAWWAIEQSIFFYRVVELPSEITSGARANMARFGIDLWRDQPLLGLGAGQFRVFYSGSYSHNNYVELIANSGLVGLLAYYVFFGMLLRRILGMSRVARAPVYLPAWLLTYVILLLLLDIGMVSYYEKTTWVSYALLLAVVYIYQPEHGPVGGRDLLSKLAMSPSHTALRETIGSEPVQLE
jgi:O-antigen ligase